MLGGAIGESENGDHTLPIGRLYITARLLETLSYATKEFFVRLSESRGLRIPGEAVFIGDVADNNGHLVCFRLSIKRNCAFDDAAALVGQHFPQTVLGATLETVQMALAGTFVALIVAFPLGFLAARNTTPHPWVYFSVRSVLNLVRTIPDLALGLLFVAAVGLGAFAGTLALAIHTATVLGKLLSESVENIDEGVVEAIRATGAGYGQILSFAVLPQILPDLISFTLYRLETNIRAASVLGLIGAGGIGYLMNTSFRTFQYQEAAAIVLVLIALVMLVDHLSSRLRSLVV